MHEAFSEERNGLFEKNLQRKFPRHIYCPLAVRKLTACNSITACDSIQAKI